MDELKDLLDWFGGNTRLGLDHYSPVFCDDDDQLSEWRVTEQRGNINDREYLTVGKGDTPIAALLNARATITSSAR